MPRISIVLFATAIVLYVAALAGCVTGSDPGAGPGSLNQAVGNCPPSPAGTVFQNALCLCDDLAGVGTLTTHAPAGGAASVGVNGRSEVVGRDVVDGAWASYAGMSGVGSAKVRDALSTTGDLTGVGRVEVGGDLSVGGNLEGVGELSVGGTLRVKGQRFTLGPATVAATGGYSAPAAPPCACNGSSFVDVSQRVAAAKAKNDNAAHGLPTSLAVVGDNEIQLTTGSYYFDHVETVGRAHFVIDGVVALFFDGSLDAVGKELVELKPGATLDLYVAGALRTVGELALGSDPSSVRLYVGGAGGALLTVGAQQLSAMIYAPTAHIAFVGDTEVHGALFGRDLAGVGRLTIDYSAPQAPNPGQCGTPGGGSGSTGSTGSSGSGSPGSGSGSSGSGGGTNPGNPSPGSPGNPPIQ